MKINVKKPRWVKRPQFRFKKLPVRKLFSRHKWLLLAVALFMGVVLTLSMTVFADLPSPSKLQSGDFPVSTQLFDRHGTLLYEIYADAYRTPVTLDEIPEAVKNATIAVEDADFYNHFGFSLQGITRAFKNTLFHDKLQGGSTITQQLVKTALLTPERTLERKLREAVLTIATEVLYSKEQILEMYLNHIPYGGTAYGIEASAQRFFGKHAKDLSLAEAALLAGLPQAPSRYSPFTQMDRAKARQQEVLRRMVEEGFITQEDADSATNAPLSYVPPATNIQAPHFVFYVKELLEEQYGLRQVERGGLRVTTTLDLELQNYAQASVGAELDALEKYKVSNGAALILKPNTGEILAMIGSKDYFDTSNDGQVNITTRLRQPGSSIKPINYVTALQTKRLTPASMLLDVPTCFKVATLKPYCPKNYDGGFRGPVSFRQALANSYNIPAVKILALNGLESMIATASAMGIDTFTDPSRYGLSLTLGGGEVTMIDMAEAFATLANQGVHIPATAILEVKDYHGQVLTAYDANATNQALKDQFFNEADSDHNRLGKTFHHLKRVLEREPAYLVGHILSDNQARSSAFGANSKLRIGNKTVSVKTGTTNDLRDNWTIGYTPQYVVATWVGNNDNSVMSRVVSGVTGAAPIWNDLMTKLVSDINDEDLIPPKPEGVVEKPVCRLTGSAPTDGCELRSELFWDEALPQPGLAVRKNIWIDKTTGQPAFFGSSVGTSSPEEDAPMDNLELQEHLVVSDPFTQEFCLDCQLPTTEPASEPSRPSFPSTTIDLNTFDPTNKLKLYNSRRQPTKRPE